MTMMINTPTPTFLSLFGLSFGSRHPHHLPSGTTGPIRSQETRRGLGRTLAGTLHASCCKSFVEKMLCDPVIQLVMAADRVSAADIRQLYRDGRAEIPRTHVPAAPTPGPVPGSQRPGIGE